MEVFSYLILLLSFSQVIDCNVIHDTPRDSLPRHPFLPKHAKPIQKKQETLITPQVTDVELNEFFHKLFKHDYNPYKAYKINLYKKLGEKFFDVKSEILMTPRNQLFFSIHENFKLLESNASSNISNQLQIEQNLLINMFLDNTTAALSTAMNFLASKGFLKNDTNEYRRYLHKLWFESYSRPNNYIPGSTGFEAIFVNNRNGGPCNWIYVARMEKQKKVQLQNATRIAIFETRRGQTISIVYFGNLMFNDSQIKNKYIFLGTSPELEMALYTVCFYARRNDDCSFSFGNVKFIIRITEQENCQKEAMVGADLSIIVEKKGNGY
ncbi:poly(U)-specific endoribonuclease-B [Copidosoma floridanum]|uniref:poly(U)-specific endoribonuclease-B n=1 Tax=Copidosoma floridanum TaxID=29053 RepID=UPI0006C993C1|nr:poly(U)-specific endoribonuclease-B [Copidosoma floridanum]